MDELLLLSGNDIPFPEGQITIHQPKLKEIAYITENSFWHSCSLLKFNKKLLMEKDKIELSNMSNFDIIMMMIQEKNIESQKARINILSLLALLFPTSEIKLQKNIILLQDHEANNIGEINENNFENFKNILISMFCLSDTINDEYNPSGKLAEKIANQLMRAKEKKTKLESDIQKIAILSRYISILAVGEEKSINDLMDYTVYQLMDEYNRYQLKIKNDIYLQFKCAGATGMEEPEDWFKDLYTDEKNNQNVIDKKFFI